MNCNKAEEYAERYENGELNEIEKRKFEKHIKECTGCRKKLGSSLLLGAMLYASEKTAIQTTLSLSWYLKKAAVVTTAAALITASIVTVSNDKEEVIASKETTSKQITSDKSGNSEIIKEADFKDGTKTESKNKKIRIISRDAEKEVEFNLNSENMKIETRNER